MPTMPEPHFFGVIRRVFGWMALLVGGGLVVGSLFVLSGRWAWHARSTTAIGEVVAHRSIARGSAGAGTGTAFRRSGARATRAEVVRFTDARGATHEFVSGVSTSFPFEVGEKVPVRYIEGEVRGASSDARVDAGVVTGVVAGVDAEVDAAADAVPDAAIDAVIDTWFRVWGLSVIFTGAGALFLGFGAVALVARRRVH